MLKYIDKYVLVPIQDYTRWQKTDTCAATSTDDRASCKVDTPGETSVMEIGNTLTDGDRGPVEDTTGGNANVDNEQSPEMSHCKVSWDHDNGRIFLNGEEVISSKKYTKKPKCAEKMNNNNNKKKKGVVKKHHQLRKQKWLKL